MKKIYVLLVLFSFLNAGAQIITFPDANLKSRLLLFGICYNLALTGPINVDANGDHEIDTTEALAVGGINIGTSAVSDLTGLIYFSNLKTLGIAQTQITNINNSLLPSTLTALNVSNLPITTIDTSYFPSLFNLACLNTNISSLDMGSNHNLQLLEIQNMPNLTTLNIKNLSSLDYSHPTMNGFCWTGCPNLTSICADASEINALQNYLANCGVNTSGISINSNCALGVNSQDLLDEVTILPNPSSGLFEVNFINGVAEKTSLMIYNVLGQEVLSLDCARDDKTVKLDLSNHPNGVYLMRIIDANSTTKTIKLIKK